MKQTKVHILTQGIFYDAIILDKVRSEVEDLYLVEVLKCYEDANKGVDAETCNIMLGVVFTIRPNEIHSVVKDKAPNMPERAFLNIGTTKDVKMFVRADTAKYGTTYPFKENPGKSSFWNWLTGKGREIHP